MKKPPKIELPKWPFYLGDLLLIALVLGIFIQARGHLDNLEIFWCITGVAIGGIIFITPFVLEYKGNIKLAIIAAKAAEREGEIIRLERILDQMSEVNDTVSKQVDKHERTVMVFESLVKRMEARLRADNEEHTVVSFESDEKVLEGEESMSEDGVELELELEENGTDYEEPEHGEPATVVAHVQMGIGGKLFVRGEGGGLNWDAGTPMEFVETGTWQWISKKTDDAIQYRIYKNDEEEAEGSALVIEPGETQEIQPHF